VKTLNHAQSIDLWPGGVGQCMTFTIYRSVSVTKQRKMTNVRDFCTS